MSRIKEIKASELLALIESDHNFEIIDIRTQPEILRGVLPQSKTLPMHLVPLNLSFFAQCSRQIVIYCRTGSRSAQVCEFLYKHGIYNAISLRGGIVSWSGSGLPIAAESTGKIA
ncbi:MAG: rhodanese-like domain-containing protein [Gammaproteobacteria bacterium]|nr:rhodanese-like domain-containing protein [Gammaproteobacteria bacterium]